MQAMLRRAIEAQKNAHRNQLVLDSGLKTEEDELSIMSGKPTFIQGDLPYRSAPKLSASSSSSSTQIYPEQGFSAYSVPPSSSSSPSGAIQSQTQGGGGGHVSTHHQAYPDAERGDSGYRPNLEVMTDMTDVSYSSGLDKSLSGSVRRPSLSTLTSPFSPYAMQGTSSTTSVGGGVSGGSGTTFADLSAGWGGLFHETAGSMGMYNYSNSGQSRGYGAGGYGQSQGHDQQQQQQHGGGGAGVNTATGVAGGSSTTGWGGNHGSSSGMGTYSGGLGTTLNDKWSSFMMNYNVLDPAPAPSLSTVPQVAGAGAGAVISGEGGQGRYSHSYSRTSHYGHSGYQ
ncbi:hypothetical protein K435DRAFT_57873 [Dendrothele bispora CBS 962.96]|uniref:Uncharacterized protein n=1 Tax=Dendrothele bispora (strain CBS 962.96) TaxID=1314807 RepID=A0A4S8M6G3_DENBC|nr:hypothetical protein K435DRAFT_57873 [Dendrothele bispora CBS 962.96]